MLDKIALAAETAPRPAAGSETILLVEDQPEVRAISRTALEAFGYRVLEAADGLEAMTSVAACAADIHLLVTDVAMPHMNGHVLAEHLQRLRPDLKVLFLSGYTGDVLVQEDVMGGNNFLSKPFTPSMLGRKVRDVFDRKRQPLGP